MTRDATLIHLRPSIDWLCCYGNDASQMLIFYIMRQFGDLYGLEVMVLYKKLYAKIYAKKRFINQRLVTVIRTQVKSGMLGT